ncbi:unnamed protein product [Trifolium pratense]|uniref:Uncharacterized protein n=1 Tax=Trifolium pratense TaxID=57577 RepID=A0ACB0IG54_TRIPR|nr:unnamed protein product [Trifolium pratense]
MEGITPISCTRAAIELSNLQTKQHLVLLLQQTTDSHNQDIYLCKTSIRYWTQGGSFRNIPLEGGHPRKNKKIITSSSPSLSSSISSHNMIKGNDLSLAIPAMDKYHVAGMLCSSPYVEISDNNTCSNGLINSANNYAPNSLMMMSSSNAQYYQSWFIM